MRESERALEEMGELFSTTKLELDSIQELEEACQNSLDNPTAANWVDDSLVKSCQSQACSRDFNIKRRKVGGLHN